MALRRLVLATVFGVLGCRSSVAPATTIPPEAPPLAAAPPVEPAPTPEPEPPAAVEPAAPPAEIPPPGFTEIPARRRGGFPGVAFTEVRAFAFDLAVGADMPHCVSALDPDGTPCETVEQPGVVLTAEQTKTLLALLRARATWGAGSKCFLPHHGFVFYDGAVPVAEISLCLMCAMLRANPAIPGARKLGDGNAYGISDKGVAAMRGLCHELGLPKCDATKPDDFTPGG